jgi:hypothetical protein
LNERVKSLLRSVGWRLVFIGLFLDAIGGVGLFSVLTAPCAITGCPSSAIYWASFSAGVALIIVGDGMIIASLKMTETFRDKRTYIMVVLLLVLGVFGIGISFVPGLVFLWLPLFLGLDIVLLVLAIAYQRPAYSSPP